MNKTREQMSEDKAAFDTQIKMMEKDSLRAHMKMESDIELLIKEKRKENEEKEEVFAAYQKDKDNLLKTHAEEKCELMKVVEEKEEDFKTLQQKYENLTSEKEKLKRDFEYSQESCSKLMKEFGEVKEDLNTKMAEQALNLQEKSNEIAVLKEELESVKAAEVDLVKKYESEIQSLSISLEAEKEHVEEAKKAMDALIDTNSKCSENIESLRDSNEEIGKEIIELKNELNNVNDKYLMLQQQSEETAQDYKSEVSVLEEKLTKQEEAQVALLKKMESNEKEKLTFVTSLQDKDNYIKTLKEEIDIANQQRSEEKAAFDNKIKMMKDSLNVQMKMESDYQLLTDDKKTENEGKEDLIIALQKDKDNLLQIHTQEKGALMKAFEEKKVALEILQQKYEKLTNQYASEEDKLNCDLTHLQNVLNVKETKELAKLKESIQELSKGFAKLKDCIKERDEKYLLTQKQADKTVQFCNREISREEYYRKQGKAQLALVDELKNIKQLVREKDEVILQLKREIKQVKEKMSEKMALPEQQLHKNKQILEREQLLMSNSGEERLMTRRQAVNILNKEQLMEITSCGHQQEALITSLNQRLMACKTEEEKQSSHIHSLQEKIIEMEQELTASKEMMQVECDKLKEQLHTTKEVLKREKKISDGIRMSYKTEVEKFTQQVKEWDQDKKERDLVCKKYDTAKKKLAETVSSLDEARTTNRQYQQQLSKCKEYIKKLEEKAEHQKETENRLMEIDSKYQPVKEKLHECENTIRHLNTEKRSLEMQLQHAESQLQEQKRIHKRESFWEQDTQKPRHMSDSQLLRGGARKPTTTSTSSEKLIKKSGRQGQSVSQCNTKDMVFRKPGSRAKAATNVKEEHQHRQQPEVASIPCIKIEQTLPTSIQVISDKSLGKSIPRSMHFRCDEEEEELFNNKYLYDMKVGKCRPDGDESWRRLSELQRRNSLYPPHMRSAYPAEMQFRPLDDFEDDKLREGCAVEDRQLMNLTVATENLELDSPAFNLRKRKSPSDSSYSETSFDSLDGKRTRRLSTSYSRPGPPTPGRRFSRGDKENRRESSASELSLSFWQQNKKEGLHMAGSRANSPSSHQTQPECSRVTRRRQLHHTNSSSVHSHSSSPVGSPSVVSKKGMTTPRGRKGMTPSSLRKILAKGKSPWRKLENSEETPKVTGDTINSNGSSKLRIFRRPFGSKNYNVLSASLRSQENPISLDNSLASSTETIRNTDSRTRRR